MTALFNSAHTPRTTHMGNTARRVTAVCIATLAMAVCAVYANSFWGVFVYDDLNSIAGNPHLQKLWPVETPPLTALEGRPVTAWTLALNYHISRLHLWSYHLVNLLIHMLSVVLVFDIVRRTLLLPRWKKRYTPDQALALGFSVALLWGLHPLHTSAVTYVVQRAESLMGLFYFVTIYSFLRSLDSRRSVYWKTLATGACLVGIGVKEPIITAPLMVLAYDWIFIAESIQEIWIKRRWFYGLLLVSWVFMALKLASGGYVSSVGVSFSDITPWVYLKTQAGVIWHYVRLVFWPRPLLLTYFWPPPFYWYEFVPQGIGLLALLAVSVWAFLRRNALGFLGLFFFIALAPSSSFLPLRFEMCCEYRMYVPLVAVICALVLGMFELIQRSGLSHRETTRLTGTIVILSAFALGTFTFRQNRLYQSEDGIWAHIAFWQPANYKAWDMLGVVLASKGEYDKAIGCHLQALKIYPGNPVAFGNLGNILLKQGKTSEAINCFERAVRVEPSPRMFFALADAQLRAGKEFDARITLEEGLRRNPDNATLKRALDTVLMRMGMPQDGVSGNIMLKK